MDESVVNNLDRSLKKIVPVMEAKLGTRLPDKVEVWLPLTRSDFVALTGGRVPNWAGGVAYPREGEIVAKAPTFFGEGIPLEILVAHELSHLLIDGAAQGQAVPRWFDEGIAQVLAGESRTGTLGLMARSALADRLMGLPRVDDLLMFGPQDANLAYAESHSAAAALVERYEWEAVRAMLFQVGRGLEFDSAFHSATGIEYEAWQVEWLESAQRRYKNFAFLDVDSLVWIFIMLLGSAAVIAVWIRKRRQFKKWLQEEETDESLTDIPAEEDEPPPAENKPIQP